MYKGTLEDKGNIRIHLMSTAVNFEGDHIGCFFHAGLAVGVQQGKNKKLDLNVIKIGPGECGREKEDTVFRCPTREGCK